MSWRVWTIGFLAVSGPASGATTRDGAGEIVAEPPSGVSAPIERAAPSPAAFTVGIDARNTGSAPDNLYDGSRFATYRDVWTASGATLVPLMTFEVADLATVDAVALRTVYEPASEYSPAEMTAIENFVRTGGGVLLGADGGFSSSSHIGNVNELLMPFGITFAASPIDPTGHDVTSFVAHPITAGVSVWGIDYQRRLEVVAAPAMRLTTGGGSDDAIAVVDGTVEGCLVVLSDQSCFTEGSDRPITFGDNTLLLQNIIDYFMTDCTPTVLAVTWGGFGAARQGRETRVAWWTELEESSAGFVVEVAEPGAPPELVGRVLARGSGSRYELVDGVARAARARYRVVELTLTGERGDATPFFGVERASGSERERGSRRLSSER